MNAETSPAPMPDSSESDDGLPLEQENVDRASSAHEGDEAANNDDCNNRNITEGEDHTNDSDSHMSKSDSSTEEGSGSDEDSDQDSTGSDEPVQNDFGAANMEVDVPEEPIHPVTPSEGMPESNHKVDLVEEVDQYRNRVYIKKYPGLAAGEPICRVSVETNAPYPDVGELANPESFEIGQLLMESGVSGRFRNSYLKLKRVSCLAANGVQCLPCCKDPRTYAVEE